MKKLHPKQELNSYLPPGDFPDGSIRECTAADLREGHAWLKQNGRWKIINLQHHPGLWQKITFGPYASKVPPRRIDGQLVWQFESLLRELRSGPNFIAKP